MLHGDAKTQRFASRLRNQMSLPEVLLWRELRKRPGGLKFRRQHPAGKYVLDFYCHSAALAVEVYGFAHECGEVAERDEARDRWLAMVGVEILRITALQVLSDVSAVVETIVEAAASSP